MTHLINSLRFEASCSDEQLAFELRQNIAPELLRHLSEVVDNVCGKYVADEDWLRVDKVEIDLGRCNAQMLTRDFAALFRAQFEKQLVAKIDSLAPRQHNNSKQQARIELFCHFLLYGILPWWAEAAELDIDAVCGELSNREPERLYEFLDRQRENALVWSRIVLQLNRQTYTSIIALFKELRHVELLLSQWFQTLAAAGVAIQDPVMAAEAIQKAVLRHAPLFLAAYRSDPAAIFKILAEIIQELAPDAPESIVETALDAFTMPVPEMEENMTKYSPLTPLRRAAAFEGGVLVQSAILGFTDPAENDVEQRFIARHAGVVLLAPYLIRFFQACELLDGMVWKDKSAQHQAVHLLKFLVTGWKKTPEYSLVLEKIICGMAIEEPVALDVCLQEFQLLEAQELLVSVINNWKALKNTSVNGLRESFLVRDGLIKRKNADWCLQVERKTLDVLLDSIPWGYSAITLPWNEYLIHVEW